MRSGSYHLECSVDNIPFLTQVEIDDGIQWYEPCPYCPVPLERRYRQNSTAGFYGLENLKVRRRFFQFVIVDGRRVIQVIPNQLEPIAEESGESGAKLGQSDSPVGGKTAHPTGSEQRTKFPEIPTMRKKAKKPCLLIRLLRQLLKLYKAARRPSQ